MRPTSARLAVKATLAVLATLSPCHLVTLSPCHPQAAPGIDFNRDIRSARG
jgi:hypothetical protein